MRAARCYSRRTMDQPVKAEIVEDSVYLTTARGEVWRIAWLGIDPHPTMQRLTPDGVREYVQKAEYYRRMAGPPTLALVR